MYLDGQRVEHLGKELFIKLERYVNKRMRIELVNADDVPYATLSTNIPEKKIGKREVIIKTWAENEGIARSVKMTGLFKDTGKRVPSTFVEAQIWKIRDDLELSSE